MVQLPHLLPVLYKEKQVLEKKKKKRADIMTVFPLHGINSQFYCESEVNSSLLLIHLHQVSQEVPVGHGLPVEQEKLLK